MTLQHATMEPPRKRNKHTPTETSNITLTSILAVMSTLNMMLACVSYVFLLCSQLALDRDEHSINARKRVPLNYKRKKWSIEQQRFSDNMFYRLFRMSHDCFNQLCKDIESEIGEKQFKSERYINKLESHTVHNNYTHLHHEQKMTVGETISGEWKVAITLRMMAGATYLDMYLWSNVYPNKICEMFSHVTKNWVNTTLRIDVYEDFFVNEDKINQTTHDFAITSDGVMNGCMGAIDGWLVCILCPTLSEVNNPGKYFTRKGFYALNVQVICDKHKRILW